MDIKVLGTGCAKCTKLEEKVRNVCAVNNISANIEKVTELPEIMKYGIMMTPGLVINGKVVHYGSIAKDSDILKWIQEAQNA